MADLHRLPSIEDAEREASEWIARLNSDDVSAQERSRFESWRKAHPRNARAYEELSATWTKLSDAGQFARTAALGAAINASIGDAIRRSSAQTAELPPVPSVRARGVRPGLLRRVLVMATAASLAAVALGSWWWHETLQPRTLFQTAIGERANIELPDGSTLELNSNSLARIDYNERSRVIRLERGEAFFKVEHDSARPFWVTAGSSWVRAVGTEFNVFVRNGGVRVTVNEGTVKVAAPSSGTAKPSDQQLATAAAVVLTAREEVDMSGVVSEVRSLPPDELTRSIAWRTGTLSFRNTPLSELVEELSRYTTLRIVIEEESLHDLPVGGMFRSDPTGAEALLTLLQDGFGLHVRREGDTAYVEAR